MRYYTMTPMRSALKIYPSRNLLRRSNRPSLIALMLRMDWRCIGEMRRLRGHCQSARCQTSQKHTTGDCGSHSVEHAIGEQGNEEQWSLRSINSQSWRFAFAGSCNRQEKTLFSRLSASHWPQRILRVYSAVAQMSYTRATVRRRSG